MVSRHRHRSCSRALIIGLFLLLLPAGSATAAGQPRRSSHTADWLIQMARVFCDQGLYDDALLEVRKALLIAPNHPEALQVLRLITERQAALAGALPEARSRIIDSTLDTLTQRIASPPSRVPARAVTAEQRGDRDAAVSEAVGEASKRLVRSEPMVHPQEPDGAIPGRPPARPLPSRGPSGITVLVDGEPVTFQRPVLMEHGTPMIPLNDMAALLGYTVVPAGDGRVQLLSPEGGSRSVTLSSSDPALLISPAELSEFFNVQARFDEPQGLLSVQTASTGAFRTYTIPKSSEELQAEEQMKQAIERIGQGAEEPTAIPEAARPDVELKGSVTYSFDNVHVGPPFRTLTTTSRGRLYGFDMAAESVRKDQSGIFQHDYSFLNLRKPDLFIGAFDQRTDLSPLRSQFEDFNGVKVKKLWGTGAGSGSGSSSRFRALEPFREDRSSTMLAWGETEQVISGNAGSATYLGQLYEARQEFVPTDWFRLNGALLYLENETDFPSLSGTSFFPRNNLVSFGELALAPANDLLMSGQLAHAAYEPDSNPDASVADWDWRTAVDWGSEPYRLRYAYEFVGKDYASLGDPATYRDYKGNSLYGSYRLTDRWSMAGNFLRYRDNVDDNPGAVTTENQAISLTTALQPAADQSLGLRFSHFITNPSGPSVGSSSRSVSYGADYVLPFVSKTRLLTSYEYFRTAAPAASDSVSHSVGTSLFRGFGKGSSWHIAERLRQTYREVEADNLNLATSFNVNYQLNPTFSSYANSTYTRDLTDDAEHGDTVSASLGVRADWLDDMTLGAEYQINSYNLDTEHDRWPRNWSLLFLVTKRFGLSSPPNFGAIEGFVFQDLNGNGVPDADEPRVEDATLALEEGGRKVLTDTQGRFTFPRLAPGSHEVGLDLSNLDPLWVSPESHRTVAVGKRKASKVYFPLIEGGSVQGRVFIDDNGDGLFQDTEEPLEDVAVILGPAEDFRKTDADGAFRFDYLLPGAYTLRLYVADLPKGYESVSGELVQLTLTAGQEKSGVDFAVRLSAPVQRF